MASDRALAVDAAAVLVVSVAICLAADQLLLMTILVPAVIALRFTLWARLAPGDRELSLGRELVFFGLCTWLGAFNDYNSVVVHRIYDYGVPAFFPELSSIPVWMLLFWGMILRFMASLTRWQRLGEAAPSDRLWLAGREGRSAWGRVLIELALVLGTRQAIYRLYLDPVWSWLPFATALALALLLFRPPRRVVALVLVFGIGGPLVESAYINWGQLHGYHLGWLWGVPVWIALWWMLAVVVWRDLSARILQWLAPRADQYRKPTSQYREA